MEREEEHSSTGRRTRTAGARGENGMKFPGEKGRWEKSQQLLLRSTETPPRGQHNHPGVREIKNRSSRGWNLWSKAGGLQGEGFGQLCNRQVSDFGLANDCSKFIPSCPCSSHQGLEKKNCHNPTHSPKLQTIPRKVFPEQDKGLEPARNPLRNRILLGNVSLQQVWTEPWAGKGEIRFSQGSWGLCQGISGDPQSCGRPESSSG